MDAIDKLYYINLLRKPERKEHFLQQCLIHAIPEDKIVRFDAIDGLTHEFSRDEQKLLYYLRHARRYNPETWKKIHGNQLSHFKIMQEMIQKDYSTILVAQDDVVFCPNFLDKLNKLMKNLPDNAEMVNIGLYKEAAFEHFVAWDFVETHHCEPFTEYVGRLKPEFNPCSLAYIITKQGAINIVNFLTRHGFRFETDHVFNRYLYRKNIMYFPNEVLATGNVDLASDIFSNFQ